LVGINLLFGGASMVGVALAAQRLIDAARFSSRGKCS
jgi:hypothetical protein